MKDSISNILKCAIRLYAGYTVYPNWIIDNLGVSKSTAYRYITRLECDLPVIAVIVEVPSTAREYNQIGLKLIS